MRDKVDGMKFAGKVAVVTGGARGQGLSHCLALAAEGADIAVVDICRQLLEPKYRLSDKDALEDAVQLIRGKGRRAIGICCDVSKSDEVQSMTEKVGTEFGRIDILVNNAGLTTIATCEEMTEEEWDMVIDVNLKGVFLCCKHVLPFMKQQKSGKIINISSIAACQPNPGGCHYGAAKSAVVNLTQSLAVEFAPWNINVNAIGPGLIHTDFQKEIARMLGKDSEEQNQKKIEMFNLFKRAIPAASISAAIAFLASEEAKDITGQIIYVDQGWTLARPKKG